MTSPVSPAQQQEQPYNFGTMRVVPSADMKLKKSSELQVLFWVYGAGDKGGKPDLTIEYNFHQKTGDAEKYFNKTAPQELNAQTLPPQFDVNAGHQLPGSLVVPLASFPEGDFRLEIDHRPLPRVYVLEDLLWSGQPEAASRLDVRAHGLVL